MRDIIVCENLVKIYKIEDLEVLALQGLDLTVRMGEMMGIVGVSGSGKSTLMNVLGGLVRPSAGTVIVDGHNLLKLSNAAINKYRREKVGFVWQQGSRNLISYLTALENVELPMILAGGSGKTARHRAEGLLEMVGLSARRDHHLAEMSGGEQQRVAIARAFINDPVLLFADEPTGNLDTDTSNAIEDLLFGMNRNFGTTLVLVTHDLELAAKTQRIIRLKSGHILSDTRTEPA